MNAKLTLLFAAALLAPIAAFAAPDQPRAPQPPAPMTQPVLPLPPQLGAHQPAPQPHRPQVQTARDNHHALPPQAQGNRHPAPRMRGPHPLRQPPRR